VYRSVQSSTDSVHSVKPYISGNLSVGSVTLYKSVWHCIGKGWFADEGRGQNNQQPTPNDNKSKWWSSFVVLVFNLHRGMCYMPSGKVQEGREGLLMGDICDWGWY